MVYGKPYKRVIAIQSGCRKIGLLLFVGRE